MHGKARRIRSSPCSAWSVCRASVPRSCRNAQHAASNLSRCQFESGRATFGKRVATLENVSVSVTHQGMVMGLLDSVLGQVLGGAAQQQQPQGGGLGGLGDLGSLAGALGGLL